jgi:hypothetical protein
LFCFLQSYEQDEDDQYNAGYDVGSFPKDFGYGPFDQDGDGLPGPLVGEQKPRILLMGLRRYVKKVWNCQWTVPYNILLLPKFCV